MTAVLSHQLTGGVTGPAIHNMKTVPKVWAMINMFDTPAALAAGINISAVSDLAVGVVGPAYILGFQSISTNFNALAFQHDPTQYATILLNGAGASCYSRKCVGNANADSWLQYAHMGDIT